MGITWAVGVLGHQLPNMNHRNQYLLPVTFMDPLKCYLHFMNVNVHSDSFLGETRIGKQSCKIPWIPQFYWGKIWFENFTPC